MVQLLALGSRFFQIPTGRKSSNQYSSNLFPQHFGPESPPSTIAPDSVKVRVACLIFIETTKYSSGRAQCSAVSWWAAAFTVSYPIFLMIEKFVKTKYRYLTTFSYSASTRQSEHALKLLGLEDS